MTHQDPTILVTRPKGAAEKFVRQLQEAGIVLPQIISPVQSIDPVAFDEPRDISGAIFTSLNAVAAVKPRDLPCWCVGNTTADAARAKGWQAISAEGDAEAVFRRIIADHPKGPLVHFRGIFARGNLAERLNAEGIKTHEIVVYRQVSLSLSKAAQEQMGRGNPVILPLFSPRSAAQLVQQGPFEAPLWVVAMSDAVASEAAALSPQRMKISANPDVKGMVAAIKQVTNVPYSIESEGNST